MSWDSYIDSTKGYCKDNADKVGIYGLDGSPWTSAAGIVLAATECQKVVAALKNDDLSSLQTGGLTVDGVKYNFLRSTGDAIICKKKDHGGIIAAKSNTAFVIVHCKEGGSAETCNVGVTAMAAYLTSINM